MSFFLHRVQKGRLKGNIGIRHKPLLFQWGFCGLKCLEFGFLTSKQSELVRRLMVRFIGRRRRQKRVRMWRIENLFRPITQKPFGVRMGQGKGDTKYFVAPLWPGKLLCMIPRRTKRNRLLRTCITRIKLVVPISTSLIYNTNITKNSVATKRIYKIYNSWTRYCWNYFEW